MTFHNLCRNHSLYVTPTIYFTLLVFVSLVSGCVTHRNSNKSLNDQLIVKFVEKETGQPLTNGYVFTKTIIHTPEIHTPDRYIGPHMFEGGEEFGPSSVYEISDTGTVKLPAGGYEILSATGFSSGYERVRFDFMGQPKVHAFYQYSADKKIQIKNGRVTVPLADIRGDSEVWKKMINSFYSYLPSKINPDTYGSLSGKEIKAIREYYNRNFDEFFEKYSKKPGRRAE